MSRHEDGTYHCDKCGSDIGNAGVDMATSVVGLDPDNPDMIRQLHFCTSAGDNPNCTPKVLNKNHLTSYEESNA